jgi:uncharacterized protein VirK/YbjX
LRRKLGKKKAFYKIRALGSREYLQVNHELHGISKAIVEKAKRTNAVIFMGKGIRKRIKGKVNVSKRTKRLINNFPYYKLGVYTCKYCSRSWSQNSESSNVWTELMASDSSKSGESLEDFYHRTKLTQKRREMLEEIKARISQGLSLEEEEEKCC